MDNKIKLIKWMLVPLTLLFGVILVNTLSFTREPIELTPLLNNAPIDETTVSTRLSQAIQHQTISYAEPSQRNPESFLKFHQFKANSSSRLKDIVKYMFGKALIKEKKSIH